MSRLLLLVLLCQIFGTFSNTTRVVPYWNRRSKVEVTLIAEENTGLSLEDIYDNFQDLFNDYGRRYGLPFTKRNLHRVEDFKSPKETPMAKFEAYGVDCAQFQNFLQEIRASNYRLKFAHIKCDNMSFSICKIFRCPESEFNGLERYICQH
ncbi:unnamed protein product [Cylicocyclus nassatus]|uniref:Uncharacterized protein n=1 Tax=Cylicocyclus nassatus TaxID=53992 RepID=A0AA36M417_CYLNA|nr:unnamed protein product [Cylicocyclus nassatus]